MPAPLGLIIARLKEIAPQAVDCGADPRCAVPSAHGVPNFVCLRHTARAALVEIELAIEKKVRGSVPTSGLVKDEPSSPSRPPGSTIAARLGLVKCQNCGVDVRAKKDGTPRSHTIRVPAGPLKALVKCSRFTRPPSMTMEQAADELVDAIGNGELRKEA